MQPTGTVWTTLIGDHPGIIPVKFGQNPISGFREDVVKKLLTDAWTPDIEGSQKLTEHFMLRWAKNIYKVDMDQITIFIVFNIIYKQI